MTLLSSNTELSDGMPGLVLVDNTCLREAGTANAMLTICVVALICLLWRPPVCASATIFAGVGNDGYFRDLQGVYTTLNGVTPLNSGNSLHENLPGSAIAESVLSLQSVLQPDDMLIWYYSGHGGWQYDGSEHDETATGSFAKDNYDESVGLLYGSDSLTDDELSQAFLSLSSTGSRIVTIFDACYAGGFIGGANDLNRVPGLTFLGSSGELEDSYSYDDQPYSIFTQGLIDGLIDFSADLDDDGLLMASEWFGFASDYTVGSVNNQHPVLWGADVLIAGVSAVPLPGAFWLLGGGLAGLFSLKRKSNDF